MGQLVNRVWFTVYCMVPGLYHVRPTQLDFLSSQSEILPGIKGTAEWLSDRAIPQNERSPQNGVISHRYQKVTRRSYTGHGMTWQRIAVNFRHNERG